jgi:hypothetical protein
VSATCVPVSFVAGTTVQYERTFSDYPADVWTYTLHLVGVDVLDKDGVADGLNFVVELTAEETAELGPGSYKYVEQVVHGDGRVFEVGRGQLEVLSDIAAVVAGGDYRTHARKTLDAIEAVLENRATVDQQQFQIAGRMLTRFPVMDLLILRDRYRTEVRDEEAAERVNKGLGTNPRRVRVRFIA